MATTKSDNKLRQMRIKNLLTPEVFSNEFSDSLWGTSIDRHLSKDDGVRIAGFVGTGNANAVVDRQIKEFTPFRQAYQLQPTAVSVRGDQTNVLTYENFLSRLGIQQVDVNRLPTWANTESFNFAPPVNLDMLINYSDYYWVGGDRPQYATIENRCNKMSTKLSSYDQLIQSYGANFFVSKINVAENTMTIDGALSQVFVSNFVFFTTSEASGINDRFWTVVDSTFDVNVGTTTIVLEPMAFNSVTPPASPILYQMWYNPETRLLHTWNGDEWELTPQNFTANISLQPMRDAIKQEHDCACNGDYGFDMRQWDDNQQGSVLWNQELLNTISYATEAEWAAAHPGPKTNNSMWNDTSHDVLNLWSVATATWKPIVSRFSKVTAQTRGDSLFDAAKGCDIQMVNDWSGDNRWKHKTEITSFGGAVRAQVPIFEYDSRMELNEWVAVDYAWKYRSSPVQSFNAVDVKPNRLELEPVKGFVAVVENGVWTMYLYDRNVSMERDIDFTDIFTPGYRFALRNDIDSPQTYTVATSTFRALTSSDNAEIIARAAVGTMVTIITLAESTYNGPAVVGPLHDRLEPLTTTRGDVWSGYQVHWTLDMSATVTRPTGTPAANTYIAAPGKIETYNQPGIGVLVVTDTYQDLTVAVDTTEISIFDTLRFSPTADNFFATGSSVSVLVDGVKLASQDYTINTVPVILDYTVVGESVYSGITVQAVNSITLVNAAKAGSTVRIVVGATAQRDVGMMNLPVRTVEDEEEFAALVLENKQPVYMALNSVAQIGQDKLEDNQYPLFNIYDVVTSEVITAAPTFAFAESQEMPINSDTRRRILATPDKREFGFEQTLVDVTDGTMYAYRNTASVDLGRFWFNPTESKVRVWTGITWSDQVLLTAPVRRLFEPTVSVQEPERFRGNVWYNPVSGELKQFQNNRWVAMENPIVNDSDPTLLTIWRTGVPETEYVPEFVNDQREPVSYDDPAGTWELLDSWFYNASHSNHKIVKYSEMLTHVRSILEAQNAVAGLGDNGAFTLSQSQYNLGLGGTIKEYNDGLDTLISATNVENVTPPALISFARQEYANQLDTIREFFVRQVNTTYSLTSPASIVDLTGIIQRGVIDQLRLNSYLANTYFDTSAYDPNTKHGVPNWVTTIPMMRAMRPVAPHSIDLGNGTSSIVHHDGHRSTISFSPVEVESMAGAIISQDDPRQVNSKLGIRSNQVAPATRTDFLQQFGGVEIRAGVYWYKSNTYQLYRFSPYVISSTAPGGNLPEGTMYFDPISETVYRLQGSVWNAAAAPGDVYPLWVEVSFVKDLTSAIMEVEDRLYERSLELFGNHPLRVVADEVDADFRQERLNEMFLEFAVKEGIEAPLANNSFLATDPFTWNYKNSVASIFPSVDVLDTMPADWHFIYSELYGTPFPHLEPWCLQGYDNKPTWWDAEYLNNDVSLYGNRRWKYIHDSSTGSGVGMWENVRTGFVPHGRLLPSGQISSPGRDRAEKTYRYMSVNIGQLTIGRFGPDDLLPPYFDANQSADPEHIRSVFDDLASQIFGTSADYTINDLTPYKWDWMSSSYYQYNVLIAEYLAQPQRTMHTLFGPDFTEVGGLQIDVTQKRVLSHKNARFHGDVFTVDGKADVYSTTGFNQWYTNFNRQAGYDGNAAFRSLWCGWDMHLSYLTASTIDTAQLQVDHKRITITDRDYATTFNSTGILDDVWIDGLRATVLASPPNVRSLDNDNKWRIELTANSAQGRSIPYYRAMTFPFKSYGDGQCTANVLDLVGADAETRQFLVAGNHELMFKSGWKIEIVQSMSNDRVYTVVTSVYDANNNTTRVNVAEPLTSSIGFGKMIVRDLNVAGLNTGDLVHITSYNGMPVPLQEDARYYIIKVTENTFKLADSANNAAAGIAVVGLGDSGDRTMVLGKVATTYKALGGNYSQKIWYHYELDYGDVRQFLPPQKVNGLQTVLNVVDGIVRYSEIEDGIVYESGDILTFDEQLGRSNTWQLEQEKFVTWADNVRNSKFAVKERWPVSRVSSDDTLLKINQGKPSVKIGERVSFTTTGTLPAPLQPKTNYYYVPGTDPDTFQVSTSSLISSSSIIHFTSAGSGTIFMQPPQREEGLPSLELNPFHLAVQKLTPLGIVADIMTGPYAETSVKQTVFDQNGKRLSSNEVLAYRQDESTIISYTSSDETRHIGGAHLYVQGFEHIVLFNDYTVAGALMYDPFVGLSVQRVELDFYREPEPKLRPTIGGYYMIDGEFRRNMEGQAEDLRNVHDIYKQRSMSRLSRYAAAMYGYRDSQALDAIGTGSKSQQLFYQGMIRAKGSIKAVEAFMNARYFDGAVIDEYWAIKTGEFGSSQPRKYPELRMYTRDTTLDDVRLLFLDQNLQETPESLNVRPSDYFQPVSFGNHSERWVDYPNTRTYMNDVPMVVNGKATDKISIWGGEMPSDPKILNRIDVYVDTADGFRAYAVRNGQIMFDELVSNVVYNEGNQHIVVITPPNDGIRVVRSIQVGLQQSDVISDDSDTIRLPSTEGYGLIYDMFYDSGYTSYNSHVIQFPAEDFIGLYDLYLINVAADQSAPTHLIDIKSNINLKTIQLWDPARGKNYARADFNINVASEVDPALYSTAVNVNANSMRPWNQPEVGQRWLNLAELEYVPYYDRILMPELNDRLHNWGHLSPWAGVRLYEWVETEVTPEQWETAAATDMMMGTPRRVVSRRTREIAPVSFVLGSNEFTTSLQGLTVGSTVVFSFDSEDSFVEFKQREEFGTIVTGQPYYVLSVNPTRLTNSLEDLAPVMEFTAASGEASITTQFDPSGWESYELTRERTYGAVDTEFQRMNPEIPVTKFNEGDIVSVYVNSVLHSDGLPVIALSNRLIVQLIGDGLPETSIIDIVRNRHLITAEEEAFNPDVEDDGTTLVQYKEVIPFTAAFVSTNDRIHYFFWVEGRREKNYSQANHLSSFETAVQLADMPEPYFVAQLPLHSSDKSVIVQYRQVIIRGVHNIVTEDGRFVWRTIRDQTLRDRIEGSLKPKHTKWEMIRRNQPNKIDRALWDKLTESMIGRSLTNITDRIPTLERELYDAVHTEVSRIGLGEGQAFTTRELAMATLFGYLADPTIDFYPIDVDKFVNTHDFVTQAGIIDAMDYIYQQFSVQDVNNIWFETLHDSLSLQPKYDDLMKTSWVSVSGVRILDVGGMFDD